MKKLPLLIALSLLLVSCGLVDEIKRFLQTEEKKPLEEYIFPGIHGPLEATPLPKPIKTNPDEYKDGGKNCLAIYLTDTDTNWLGLVRGFKSIGIPFIITQDYHEALSHKVVFAYPYLSYPVVNDKDNVLAIKDFLRKGGILLTGNVYGSLNHIFGIHELNVNMQRDAVLFKDLEWTKDFTHPNEKTVYITYHKLPDGGISTTAFKNGNHTTIATYEDHGAAIISKHYGEGDLIVFGFDLGFFVNNSLNNMQPTPRENYVNQYIPGVDVFLRLIKEIYREKEPNPVFLHTVPYNKSLTVIYTHDLDYNLSVPNALEFAKFEKSQNYNTTYFVLNHYIRDYNDLAYFNNEAIDILNQVHDLGRELGSEAISHSEIFDKFPLGTGKETYPEYKPIVLGKYSAVNGSIMGELRVSKFLLETLIHNLKIVSFRPGGLRQPRSLPQCLRALGYKYTSSNTANDSWTHLPYQLTYELGTEALEDVFQFPITIEDEAMPRMDKRVGAALDVAKNISRYGGLCLVLSHPNVVDYKLVFEKAFFEGVKGYSWIGSVKDFGRFWAARNKITIDVQDRGREKLVSLKIPQPISGFTLIVPKGWSLKNTSTNVIQQGQSVLIDQATGDLQLTFDL